MAWFFVKFIIGLHAYQIGGYIAYESKASCLLTLNEIAQIQSSDGPITSVSCLSADKFLALQLAQRSKNKAE